ncbi:uncharacterized protein [Diadema setosum]|uniref:uncharacterized protein n=1 Tax=Diadema setosum TaxID=31175 RepID=UPI003B3BB297
MPGTPYCIARLTECVAAQLVDVKEKWKASREFVRTRPLTALFLTAASIALLLPLSCFLFVVSSSFILSLLAFFCIQGTVVAIATVVLIPSLIISALFATGLVVFVKGTRLVWDAVQAARRTVVLVIWPRLVELRKDGVGGGFQGKYKFQRCPNKNTDPLAKGDFSRPSIKTTFIDSDPLAAVDEERLDSRLMGEENHHDESVGEQEVADY